MRRCLTLLCAVLFAVILGGCDLLASNSPDLSVSPQSVHFGPDDMVHNLRIDNKGGGTVAWTASTSQSWLLIEGASSGETTLEIDEVVLTLNRSEVTAASNSATVTITQASGPSIEVPVTVAVVGPPLLEVSSSILDFPVSASDTQIFTITNGGGQLLEYTLSIPNALWLTVTPMTGTLDAGASTAISATISRSGLSSGTLNGTITISSPGIDDVAISVSLDVEPFSVSPTVIDFGRILEIQSTQLEVNNSGGGDLDVTLTVSTSSGGNWLSVDPSSGTVTSTTSLTTLVTANLDGLAPGIYEGEVSVEPVSTGTPQVVPVTMEVAGFVVSPESLDFGTIETSTSSTFTVTNLGSQPTGWSISVPAPDAAWLSVSPSSGSTLTSDEVTVTVDPTVVDPGLRESELSVLFDDGAGVAIVSVSMARPRPPELKVEPGTIDFGVSKSSTLIGIWNDGTGTIGWRIDTSTFPAWLSIADDSPVQPDGAGIASGVVSGSQTDSLILAVDRSEATLGEVFFDHAFTVEASQDSTDVVPIAVTMEIAEFSIFNMHTDLNFSETDEVLTFVISNELGATGSLDWRLDPEQEIPAFLASISPSQGLIEPSVTSDADRNITVRVDRESLDFNGGLFELNIVSNDPENPVKTIRISVDVPLVARLSSRPSVLDFDEHLTTLGMEIANVSDPNSVANFVLTPSQDWINVFEEGGQSIGVVGPLKDWIGFSVSIDRSKLPNDSPSAEIVATAIDASTSLPIEDADGNPIEVTIEVKATAASLTIELPRPRLRIPSLIRFTMLMRNARYQAMPIPRSMLEELGDSFIISEKGTPLELEETNQFLSSGGSFSGSNNRLKTNVLILLDYSGSMFAAAQVAAEDGQLGSPPPDDPLQFIYEDCISELIDGLPDTYRIGLAYFNDRTPTSSSPFRIVRPTLLDPVFTRDKFELQSRLTSITVIDHGGTELLPAIQGAALLFEQEDVAQDLIAFDDADVRALILVTDGRLTTPPGNIGEVEQVLVSLNTRLFAVGWGENVIADPLIRLGTTTGGHFYGTAEKDTGILAPGGNSTLKIPLVEGMWEWCEANLLDPCDQSITKDLQSQVVLSYVTLREDSGLAVGAEITFNDPNDNDNFCLDDVIENKGGFLKSQLDTLAIRGDQRLGQISMRSEGIQPSTTIGTAEIFVRAEYVPRNVSRYSFLIDVSGGLPVGATMVVEQVSTPQGGLLQGWQSSVRTITKGAEVGRTEYSYSLPEPVVAPVKELEFGDFGDLLKITFDRIDPAIPLTLLFDVVDPVYDLSVPDAKYISAPDSFELSAARNFAPAFPIPVVETFPLPMVDNQAALDYNATLPALFQFDLDVTSPILDLGTGINTPVFTISNRGGHHTQTGVQLNWLVSRGGSTFFLNLDGSPEDEDTSSEFGAVASTFEFDAVPAVANRDGAPGLYFGDVNFSYLYGSLGIEFVDDPIYVFYQVVAPILEVTPDEGLDFGLSATDLTLTIRNAGQSTLFWELNFGAIPSWLIVNQTFGELRPGDSLVEVINISISRELLIDAAQVPAGETRPFPDFNLVVSTPFLPSIADVTIPVLGTVSNP